MACVSSSQTPEREPPHLERSIADLALRQQGVVTAAQLRLLGLSHSAIRDRAAIGRLNRIYRGVYAPGHAPLTVEGRWMAAVLACGSGALLSHRSAAALWGLRQTARAGIDITSETTTRTRPGIDIHRARALAPHDRATVRGIPCTSASRTLLDLADVLNRRQLERACNQAEVLQLLPQLELDAVLATPGRRATHLLRHALGDGRRSETLTRSELEERFLALCRSARLPCPRANAWIALDHNEGYEVDFLWARQRVVAETDGRAFHATRRSFESDRRRDQRLIAAGYRVLRFTWDQVTSRPQEVAGTLNSVLTPP